MTDRLGRLLLVTLEAARVKQRRRAGGRTSKHQNSLLLALMFGWIVWVQASKGDLDLKRPRVSEWEPVNAASPYATLAECETALAFQADAFEFILKQRDPEAKRHGRTFLSHDNTYVYGHEFSCISDTVEPRGPKGRSR